MNEHKVLPFTIFTKEALTLEEALYELLANAIDASSESFMIDCNGGVITIEDDGKGLKEQNIEVFGSSEPLLKRTGLGQHGYGLKECIAFFVRNKHYLTIEACTKKYTFGSTIVGTNELVSCDISKSERSIGTLVTIKLENIAALKAVEKTKQKFIYYCVDENADYDKLRIDGNIIHRYNDGLGNVFVKGGLVTGHVSLNSSYNFHQITPDMRKYVTSNHTFAKKNKFIELIAKYEDFLEKEKESIDRNPNFWMNKCPNMRSDTLRTSASAASSIPRNTPSVSQKASSESQSVRSESQSASSPPQSVAANLAGHVNAHCNEQDYFIWTMTSCERENVQLAYNKMKEYIKMSEVGVASIHQQGSISKNTFIPRDSDVDVVVFINNFASTKSMVVSHIKDKLRAQQVSFMDSGENILICQLDGVSFDLVLVDSDPNNSEHKKYVEGLTNVQKFFEKHSKNELLKIESFIRAMKYWVKRSGIPIKSYEIEGIVASLSTRDFKAFLNALKVDDVHRGRVAEALAVVG